MNASSGLLFLFFDRMCRRRRLPTTSSDYQSMPPACAWGKDNELKAKNAYISNMETKRYSNLEVLVSGIVIDTTNYSSPPFERQPCGSSKQ